MRRTRYLLLLALLALHPFDRSDAASFPSLAMTSTPSMSIMAAPPQIEAEGGIINVQQRCYYRTYQVICGNDCTTIYVWSGGVKIPQRRCTPRYCPQSQRICS